MSERDGASEKTAWTVAGLTARVRALLKPLERIYLEGEISGWRVYPSGHAYFTLKDAEAQVSCVMFASAFARCRAAPQLKDGAKVCLYGRVDVYGPRGQYQFVALAAKIAGQGDLQAQFEALKAKLAAEGLFEPSRKVPLPFLPKRVGLVTSPAGAVVHDMCTVMLRRFPNLEILLYPVKVQGEGAKEEIAAGLAWMDAHGMDVVIVGRGGGSIEDLWAFNEECVVRAVAAMKTPVVSAVGHETDFTLCDFAADLRAGTPSIAAERVVPEKAALVAKLNDLVARLGHAPRQAGEHAAQTLDLLSARLVGALKEAAARAELPLARASQRLAPALREAVLQAERRLERAAARLDPPVQAQMRELERRLAAVAAKLPLLDPENPLKRGYAIAFDAAGRVVRSAAQLKPGDDLVTRLADGSVTSVVRSKQVNESGEETP